MEGNTLAIDMAYHLRHVLDRERVPQHAVAHATPGGINDLAFLQMKPRLRKAIEIAGMVVMQMGNDDVPDAVGLDAEAIKRIGWIERQFARPRLGFFGIETGIDQNIVARCADQPDEIVEVLGGGLVRIGQEIVQLRRARRHGCVAERIDSWTFPIGFAFVGCGTDRPRYQATVTGKGQTPGAHSALSIGIDWATGEALAFCTLLQEGHHVRLSGRTRERGTFSQRHSVLIDQEDESRYTPFNHLGGDQGHYEVINSLLSEEAVLGFEYGYSLAEPNALTMWEAQFGDFANGAQVLFDQFISSGERKWLRMSGLVCLLPHGYEGQGPEHSSARLERFLQMCAEDNMQVVNPTTPANYFHVLRRQLHREIRKPLIVMTPKSLLRHKRAVSRLDELGAGTTFHRMLYDDAQMLPDEKIKLVPDDKIRRIVLCSGKVYYDLYDEREKRGIDDVYLMRVEQLYPVPLKALVQELGRFKNAELVWCQEEPRNMGAWHFIEPYLEWVLNQINAPNKRPRYAGRAAAAATATGLMSSISPSSRPCWMRR